VKASYSAQSTRGRREERVHRVFRADGAGVRGQEGAVRSSGLGPVISRPARQLPLLPHLLLGRGHHGVGGDAELLLQLLERRRRPERLHADRVPGGPHVLRPAERGRLLHRDEGRHRRRQYLLAVAGVLWPLRGGALGVPDGPPK